jgi:hypothetical protein
MIGDGLDTCHNCSFFIIAVVTPWARTMKGPRCYNCNNFGHLKKDCRKKRNINYLKDEEAVNVAGSIECWPHVCDNPFAGAIKEICIIDAGSTCLVDLDASVKAESL